jgi:hypothetical protein
MPPEDPLYDNKKAPRQPDYYFENGLLVYTVRKLGVNDRIQAAVWALQSGVV